MNALSHQTTMKKSKKNTALWLIIGIPLTSVVMGVITLTLALNSGDGVVQIEDRPLSKTSWSEEP